MVRVSASFLIAAIALAAPQTYAVEGPPRPPPKEKQNPGGPILSKQPDLVVEKVAVTWGNSSPCTGPHTAVYRIAVTIRNAGFGAAAIPGGWSNWVAVWSTLGGGAPPFKAAVYGTPAQLASGETHVFKTNLAVLAQVMPDKKKSQITVGALADPDGVIAEVNENNNTKYSTLTFTGELCPAGK